MSCSRGDADAVGTEGSAEAAGSGRLVVDDVGDKVISDQVVASATQIDTESRPGAWVVVLDPIDLVVLDDRPCGRRAQYANRDAVVCRTRCNIALEIDGVCADQSTGRTADGDPCGRHLVNLARNRIADLVLRDLKAGQHGCRRRLH